MTVLQNGEVMVEYAIVSWDGLNRPKQLKPKAGETQGGWQHSLAVLLRSEQAEYGELYHAVETEKKKQFPNGIGNERNPTFVQSQIVEYPASAGYLQINCVTYSGMPRLYDEQKRVMEEAAFLARVYAGAAVKVLLTPRAYGQKGGTDENGNPISKGMNFWLQGVALVDTTLPKLSVAGGGMNASAVDTAFGSSGMHAPANAPAPGVAPGYTPPPPPSSGAPAPGTLPPSTPAPYTPPPPPGAAPAPTPPQSTAPVPPNPAVLAPPAPTPPVVRTLDQRLTEKAGAGMTWAVMAAGGWTEENAIAHGYLLPA